MSTMNIAHQLVSTVRRALPWWQSLPCELGSRVDEEVLAILAKVSGVILEQVCDQPWC